MLATTLIIIDYFFFFLSLFILASLIILSIHSSVHCSFHSILSFLGAI